MLFGGHPHTLALGRNWLWSVHIGEYDVSIKVSLIDKLGRCIETSTTTQNTLPLSVFALFPNEHLALVNLSVKGDYGKGLR